MYCVARVHRKIEDDRFDLGWVRGCLPEIFFQDGLDTNGPTDRPEQEVSHTGNRCIEINRFRLKTLSPRKCEKLRGKFGSSLGSLSSPFDITPNALISCSASCQFEITQHASQQIVEIMSDPAGHLTNDLHFLRLCKSCFRLPTV